MFSGERVAWVGNGQTMRGSEIWVSKNHSSTGDLPAVRRTSQTVGQHHLRRDRFNSCQIKKEKIVFHEEMVAWVGASEAW